MKPHLLKLRGLWFCKTQQTGSITGVERSATLAYKDWVRLIEQNNQSMQRIT